MKTSVVRRADDASIYDTPAMPHPVRSVPPAPASSPIQPLIQDSEPLENSDVFLCPRKAEAREASQGERDEGVMLFVYGWNDVEPGPLSWAFPSLKTALDAVRKMKNAIGWSIVAGHEFTTVEAARAARAALIEQG